MHPRLVTGGGPVAEARTAADTGVSGARVPFIAHVDLAGRPVGRDLAARALAALAGLGRGEAALEVARSAALGALAVEAEPSLGVLLDGRLDNRADLQRQLDPDAPGCSDAALVLAAYRRWGRAAFERLEGPFAAVVWDEGERRLVAARDALGDRPLVYAVRDGLLRVSTHERALLADPAMSRELDEASAARYFAYRAPASTASYFAKISALPPGCLLVAEGGRLAVERFTRLSPARWTAGGEEEAVESFGDLFRRAVESRLAGDGMATGVLMSGGIDSTSIAAVAAATAAGGGRARPIPVTWVFDSLTECDERFYAASVAQHLGLGLRAAAADSLLPLAPSLALPEAVERPGSDLYHPLLVLAFRAASKAGLEVLLAGHHANQLWQGGDGWLRDLVARGRLATGVALAASLLASREPASARWRQLRSAGGRLIGRPRKESIPAWMTPWARVRLETGTEGGTEAAETDPRGPWGPLRPYWTEEAARLRQSAAEHGMELRMPYRDRRLVEMMLGLPADLLYRPVVSKWLQREAMRGLLPEVARRRQRPANLYLWAERGLLTIHRRELFARLAATEPAWGRFVAPGWLLPRLESPSPEPRTVHVAWRCLSFGSWLELVANGRMSSDHGTLGRGVRA